MDINLDEVSYAYMGTILHYLVLIDSTMVKADKADKVYQDIKAHTSFIRISRNRYVNYYDIDKVTSIAVRMGGGKVFGYSRQHQKLAIEKYLKIYRENIWRDALRD